MKIQIHNFGPINFFESDLDKDLHLVVGDNNIGKSYAITVIYLILKSLMESRSEFYFFQFLEESQENLKIKAPKINLANKHEETDISEQFRDSLRKILEIYLLKNFQHYFSGTFDSIESVTNIYTTEKLRIVLSFKSTEIEIGTEDNSFKIIKIDLKKTIKSKCISQNRRYKETHNEISIYNNIKNIDHFGRAFSTAVLSFYLSVIEEVLTKIRSIHYLPASRSGLYQALTAFGQIVAQLSRSRSFVTEKIELPAISVPLSDYFLELSEIKISRQNYESNPINRVAENIETDILKGKVEFNPKNKKLFYVPEGSNLRLDISSTSSMVSEISPIVSFIRHILTKSIQRRRGIRTYRSSLIESQTAKALVFIEEPEAHLHPANQIKLLKAFANLLNCNVKIMMTSHSNYIFNKLNNLILEKTIDVSVVEAIIMKQSNKGSKGTHLPKDDLGIDDENFLDVAEQLYDEKINFIEKLNL